MARRVRYTERKNLDALDGVVESLVGRLEEGVGRLNDCYRVARCSEYQCRGQSGELLVLQRLLCRPRDGIDGRCRCRLPQKNWLV